MIFIGYCYSWYYRYTGFATPTRVYDNTKKNKQILTGHKVSSSTQAHDFFFTRRTHGFLGLRIIFCTKVLPCFRCFTNGHRCFVTQSRAGTSTWWFHWSRHSQLLSICARTQDTWCGCCMLSIINILPIKHSYCFNFSLSGKISKYRCQYTALVHTTCTCTITLQIRNLNPTLCECTCM